MIKVIIRGHWANYVGTDYCYALGIYNSLDEAMPDAETMAWESYEPDEDDSGIEDEGPDFWVEEYDPEKHDMLRGGGGSFEDEFSRMMA